MSILIGYAVSGFALSFAISPMCRWLARRLGFVAKPREDRWHERPTALFGGVGIALSVLVVYVVAVGPLTLPVLVIGAGVMFAVGLVDDLISLKPYTKLIAEIAIASGFLFFGYRLEWVDSPTLDMLITMVWIVGLTNAFNLLDNMDGLCAGIALIAGTALLGTFVLSGTVAAEAHYLAVLLGATAGFLVYNFHPASIFMGDCGSLFIGINLALLTLRSPFESHGATNVLSIVVGPLLVALIPIFDTTLVTVSRVISGRSAAQGGRDHSSHRLVAIGLSERAAVAVLWTLAACGGVLALSVHGFGSDWTNLAAAVFALAMIIFAVYLARVRVYDDTDAALLRSGRITPFVVNFMHRRRVAEVMLDVCLVSIAYYAAYSLRFEGEHLQGNFRQFMESLPIMIAAQMVALFVVGAYRGVWRYFGLMDGVTFTKGVLLGTAGAQMVILYLYRFETYSRSVFVIYAALLLLLLTASRASFRLMSEFASRRRKQGERLVIYGAGGGGAIAVRELMNNLQMAYRILGFIDDDPAKQRIRVQGYPVIGTLAKLEDMIATGVVDAVLVSCRSLETDRLRAVNRLVALHGVKLIQLHLNLEGVDSLHQSLRMPSGAAAVR